jgi:hypothetical protein
LGGDALRKLLVSCVCQTPGLAESLSSAGLFHVTAFPVFDHGNQTANHELLSLLGSSDVWVTTLDAPPLEQQFPKLTRVSVPVTTYGAFHPDFAAITPKEPQSQPLRVKYHSGIVAACFKHRVPARRVAELFNKTTYSRLGFFDAHAMAIRDLQMDFERSSLQIRWREIFRGMKKFGPFMHTPTHPNAHAHRIIAEEILVHLTLSSDYPLAQPTDYLAYLRWPLYPGLETITGVAGNYYWVLKDQYNPKELRLTGLENFINYYYSRYEAEPLIASRNYTVSNTLGINFETLLS